MSYRTRRRLVYGLYYTWIPVQVGAVVLVLLTRTNWWMVPPVCLMLCLFALLFHQMYVQHTRAYGEQQRESDDE